MIETDGELYMIHHYLQRGILPEHIINLDLSSKLFYKASLELFIEEENRKFQALAGEQ